MQKQQRKEDTYEFQKNRLEELLQNRAPGKEIRFGDQLGLISFVIKDTATGTVLVTGSGEWMPSFFADKSDDQVWKFIHHLSNGKL